MTVHFPGLTQYIHIDRGLLEKFHENLFYLFIFVVVWTPPTTSPCHYTTGIHLAVE